MGIYRPLNRIVSYIMIGTLTGFNTYSFLEQERLALCINNLAEKVLKTEEKVIQCIKKGTIIRNDYTVTGAVAGLMVAIVVNILKDQ
jgi:hypothetical protein